MENPKLNYSDYDFKFILQNYFSSIYELEIVNIKDTQLANYNLLKEIDDLYSDYYTLYKSNQYTTLPSLTRLLFEKFIYLTYINKEAEQTVNIRAKRYLDRSEYDLQKFHEYVFEELVNPIYTRKDNQVIVNVAVKYLDQETKATQISQFELTLEKQDNWKIVK